MDINTPENTLEINSKRNLKSLILILIFVIIFLIVIIFYLVINNNSKLVSDYSNIPVTSNPKVSITPTSILLNSDYANKYLGEKYKVIATLHNGTGLYDLVIMTARSEYTDETCGSIYTAPSCIFVRQKRGIADATLPDQYLGEWQSNSFDSMILSSLKFIDSNIVEFRSSGEDDGNQTRATVQVNLLTGEIKEISRD